MPKLLGALRLLRLSNSLTAAALVLLGARLAGGWPVPAATWTAALAMWCVTSFGYVSNDCFDIAEDSVNKPDRPLPSHSMAPAHATALAAALSVCAALLSTSIGFLELCTALLVMGLLLLYNYRLKDTPGAGNALVAVLAGCTLLAGAYTVTGLQPETMGRVILPALMLTLFIAAREVLKTVEDAAGDELAGRRTLAAHHGVGRAFLWYRLLGAGACLLSLLPFLLLGYSVTYLALVVAGVAIPLLFSGLFLRHHSTTSQVSATLAILKASYFFGLLALLAA